MVDRQSWKEFERRCRDIVAFPWSIWYVAERWVWVESRQDGVAIGIGLLDSLTHCGLIEGEIYGVYRKDVYSIRGMMESRLVIPRNICVGVVALAKISDAAIPRPSAVVRWTSDQAMSLMLEV
jgi:hypothetical protein